MRILLLGAGGFIGRHIMAELLQRGHAIAAVVRQDRGLRNAFPNVHFEACDLAHMNDAVQWTPLLQGIDLIINAAGVLRGRDMTGVHVEMPRALYQAATATGVRRAILISAISARPDVATDYARTKLEGERVLRDSGLSWTILRPSLVIGDGSYGGTSLLRGLAGLPLFVPLPGHGEFAFSPIHARDLARAVRIVGEDARFDGVTLEPAGPETLTLRDLLARYRSWLGIGKLRPLPVPLWIMRLFGRMGDLFGTGPIATNSLVQMIAGNAGDGEAFANAVGFRPRRLEEILRNQPSQVQDRWHARLFFLAPLTKMILVVLWLASAWLGVACGATMAEAFVTALGWSPTLADPLRIGTSLLDAGIAVLLLADRTARLSTIAQITAVAGYTLVLGIAMPHLWLDPLGPLLKNLPILALILVHGAIGDRR